MNANLKEIVSEGAGATGKTTRPAWQMAQGAIHSGRRILSALFAPWLIAVLNLLPAGRVTAQTFTTLHSFTATSTNASGAYANSDGVSPVAGLITNSSGNTLYGTALRGGSSGYGTVFAINTDGTGFRNLHNFAFSDGVAPEAVLILPGNTLYGTASGGGSAGAGTVFALNTDGTGFTNLHSFISSNDGAYPFAGLILSGNTLYGTASGGGSAGAGTVFAINTGGTGFTNLHSFTATSGPYPATNTDGAGPYAGLVLSGNTLYGTAYHGGNSGNGTVFAVNTNGTGFTNLHSFVVGSDGAGPRKELILSGNTLYGTADSGGSSGYGTLFAVNTHGTGFTNLHSFTSGPYTNSDGEQPEGGLILSGSTLYGTATHGGSSGYGTVFAINTAGTGFTTLHSFTEYSGPNSTNSDGALPDAGLILSGNTLYGTAYSGGSSGNGTVFSLSFRPQLTITPSGIPPSGIILTWPTNVAGFDYTGYTLQSTTNLISSAVWSTNSPAPVVIAGQNTVTNPITGAQKFYRLSQ